MSVRILLYVDDLVIDGANLEEIGHVKPQFEASFDMKDLRNLHYFLGMEVIPIPDYIASVCHYKAKPFKNFFEICIYLIDCKAYIPRSYHRCKILFKP